MTLLWKCLSARQLSLLHAIICSSKQIKRPCGWLQIRALLFLMTLTVSIVDSLSDLEDTIPVALGYEMCPAPQKAKAQAGKLISDRSTTTIDGYPVQMIFCRQTRL